MRRLTRKLVVLAALVVGSSLFLAGTALAHGTPTCSDVGLNIEVHGDHIKRDYVFQEGATNAAGGAKLPGGAGPAFHFPNEVAPGASFCTDANSAVIYEKNPNLSS